LTQLALGNSRHPGPIQASFTAKDRETNQGMPPGYGGEFAISTAILTVHGSRAPLALPQPSPTTKN